MKKFFIHIALFMLPILIFLFFSDYIITTGLKKTKWGEYKEWNEIFSGKINADLIINGSSRPLTSINPAILDSILELKSYNLAMNGHDFYMIDTRLSVYLKFNRLPKVIVQVLDIHSLRKNNKLPFPEAFLPYLDDSEIFNSVKSYNYLEYTDYLIPSLKYLYNYKEQFIGYCEYFHLTHFNNNKYKGYRKIDLNSWDRLTDKFIKSNPNGVFIQLDSISINKFNRFLKNSIRNNVKLILVYNPEYIEYSYLIKNRDEIIDLYKKFANKYNLTFIDYSEDAISYNKNFFYNSNHLNAQGAKYYSYKLAHDIKEVLKAN